MKKKTKQKSQRETRDRYLNNKYGVGIDYYDEKFKEQKGACICGRKPKEGKSLNLDHNHKTGASRGLLCYICNLKCIGPLERFNSNPYELLLKIKEYFEKYGTKDLEPKCILKEIQKD